MKLQTGADCGIYAIENIADGRRYVGSSRNIQRRWYAHHRRFPVAKYRYWILYRCEQEILRAMEQMSLDLLRPELNKAPRAGGGAGYCHTPEAMAKMSGRMISTETRAKMSLAQLGNKKGCGNRSHETCARIAAARLGCHLSSEARAKIGVANSQRVVTPETRARMSIAQAARWERERRLTHAG